MYCLSTECCDDDSFFDPPMYIRMVDRDMGEVVQPSDEQEGTSPLLNRASMDENEEQMTSHSSMVVDDMLTLKIRVSSDGRTFSLPTRRSNRCDNEKSIFH